VATDTDILVILIGRARKGTFINLLSPATSKIAGKIYNIDTIKSSVGNASKSILFVHAMTGCDTTSALKNKGKAAPWKMLLKNSELREYAQVFNSPSSTREDIATAGEDFVKRIYGCEDKSLSIDDFRVQAYRRIIRSQPVTGEFDLGLLPPTKSALIQHSYRAYLQVNINSVSCTY